MIVATTGPSAYWYATRGTGVVALLLLTAATALGIAASTRWSTPRLPRFAVGTLHRDLTLLAVAFVAVHVVTTVADGFAPIGLRDGIVPFLSPYRPLWLGLGAVAFDLLLALVVTSLLRTRIGLRPWRAVHWLAYASWPVALLHSLGTGTDARTGWLQLVAGGSLALVAAATLWRAAAAADARPALRIGAAATTVAVSAGLVVWFRGGPLRHGWAARAGTPARLVAHAAAPAVAPRREAVAATAPATPFRTRLSGTIAQAGPDEAGLVTISIRATLRDGGGGLRLLLRGVPLEDGGVSMTASGVSLSRAGRVYTGSIVGLDGADVAARLRDAGGHVLELALALHVDPASGRVAGLARGGAAGALG